MANFRLNKLRKHYWMQHANFNNHKRLRFAGNEQDVDCLICLELMSKITWMNNTRVDTFKELLLEERRNRFFKKHNKMKKDYKNYGYRKRLELIQKAKAKGLL